MRAVVFNGPFDVKVVTKPTPQIRESTDAILKVSSTALCGSDLVRSLLIYIYTLCILDLSSFLKTLAFAYLCAALLSRPPKSNSWVCLRARNSRAYSSFRRLRQEPSAG